MLIGLFAVSAISSCSSDDNDKVQDIRILGSWKILMMGQCGHLMMPEMEILNIHHILYLTDKYSHFRLMGKH